MNRAMNKRLALLQNMTRYESVSGDNAPLYDTIASFITKNAQCGVEQRSPEWFEMRIESIGGSQISSALGSNYYEPVEMLIKKKLNIVEPFNGNIKTQWGCLFEPVIKRHAEYLYQTKILGCDVFVTSKRYPGTSYSPDGIGVTDSENGRVPTLFEFKCPWGKVPRATRMPDINYKLQVQYGMHILDGLCDTGRLLQAVYRRSRFDDLSFKNTNIIPNTEPTKDKPDEAKIDPVLGCHGIGFIGMYFSKNAKDTLTEVRSSALDISDEDDETFEFMMELINEKLVVPWYSTIFVNGTDADADVAGSDDNIRVKVVTDDTVYSELISERDAFYKEIDSKGLVPIGVLGWKQCSRSCHTINKESDFMDESYPKIKKIVKILSACNKIRDKRERRMHAMAMIAQMQSGINPDEDAEYSD